jgi:hypothetical protein
MLRLQANPLTLVAIIILVFFTGCTRTQYVPLGNENASPISPFRQVGFKKAPSLDENFPRCTIILKTETGPGLQKLGPIVEEALSRHLSRKLGRVVDSSDRAIVAQRAALDLVHKSDVQALAQLTNCSTYIRSRVIGSGKTNLLVWSQVQVGIEVAMVRATDEDVQWRARHMAQRSDGGVPLTPIGAIVDTYSSIKFSSDGEIIESIIDDTIRRIVRSLTNPHH